MLAATVFQLVMLGFLSLIVAIFTLGTLYAIFFAPKDNDGKEYYPLRIRVRTFLCSAAVSGILAIIWMFGVST